MSVAALRKSLDKTFKGKEKPYVSWKDIENLPRISTGSLLLDKVLGGGLVPGRIYQIYGPESGGKTMISSFIAGTFQTVHKLPVLWIDAEQAYDPSFTKRITAFDITKEDDVLYSQEESGGAIYEMIEQAANNGIKLAVLDSTDAMLTEAEENADYGDAMMGQKARLNSLSLAKLKGHLRKTGTILILISQTREKIGATGETEGTSGGNAIRFYSSVRARVSKIEWLKVKDEPVGHRLRFKTRKNKTGTPFLDCELDFYFDKGFDHVAETVDLAVNFGIIDKGGAWYNFEGKAFQGKNALLEYIRESEDFEQKFEKLRNDVKSNMAIPLKPSETPTSVEISESEEGDD